MAAPTNLNFATATEITGPLPASISQQVDDAGTTYTVYYKYTATDSDVELSIWAFGDLTTYQPKTTIWRYPGPLEYLVRLAGPNLPIQIPVTPGETYYIQVVKNAGNPSPANLTVSLETFAQSNAPIGSLLVCDDSEDFPAVVLDAATGAPRQFLSPFPQGENADILTSGIMLFQDRYENRCRLVNPSLTLANVVALDTQDNAGCLRACYGTQRFWATYRNVDADFCVRSIDADGTLGAEHVIGSTSVAALAAANDESIMYHSGVVNGTKQIYRYDLATDTPLSDLVAAIANYTISDLIVLPDDSILALYYKTTATVDVKALRYSAAGATLDTYNFGSDQLFPGGGAPPRMATGVDPSLTFWVWTHPASTPGLSLFQEVQLSDGAILTTFSDREYESGVYNGTATATPDAMFGHSFSCPLVVLRSATVPVTPTAGPQALAALRESGRLGQSYIVRVRRFPHSSDEQERIFYTKFQLDCQVGVGVAYGQGSDPKIELRWSNDGGYTFSNWRTLNIGRQGEYRARAIAFALGMARDRVFEIRQSDPVQTAWLTAYLDLEGGAL